MAPSTDTRSATVRSEVVGCGYQSKAIGVGCWNRDLMAYALVYLLDGGGCYADENTPERRVTAGDVLVLFPGLRHSYYNPDQPSWTEVWLVFRGGLFAQLEEEGVLERTRPVLHPGLDPAVIEAFASLHGDSANQDWRDGPGLVARVHQLCTDIVRRDHAQGPQADLAQRACALLGESLHLALDVHRVAERMGMGYEAFRKFFVAAVGEPPARYRQLKRIEQARRLLLEETIPLASIADRLGYCDEYFFNRQFTRITGISPARFRRDFARTSDTQLPSSGRTRS